MSYSTPYAQPQQQPPYIDPEYQRRQDEDHLRLLSIFHYIYGGLILCGGLFFLIYILMGLFMATAMTADARSGGDAAAGVFVGGIFGVFGLIGMVVCAVLGGLKIWAGRCLQARHGYTLATVVACLDCLSVPLGTILGACTLVLLSRPSVRASFHGEDPYHGQPSAPLPPDGDWYRRG